MLIPANAIIAEAKIRDYLFVPQIEGDKSKFLSIAGYSRTEYWELLRNLRALLPHEATFDLETEFGRKYSFRTALKGPNGKSIAVKTVWEDNRIAMAGKL